MAPQQNNRNRRGGKGRGKGNRKNNANQGRKQEEFLAPLDFEVNTTKRFAGTCVYFNRRGGFGFIKPSQEGVVPNDKVMCYWKEIKSTDRWPYIYRGLEVEFNLARFEKANGKGAIIKATDITLPKGGSIDLQDAQEAKMTYVHSKNTRFTGEVKFYHVGRGSGIVTLDPGYAGVEDVPTDLRIVRNEIQSGEEAPVLRNGLKVEFGIQKSEKGFYSCYALSMPGGSNVSRAVVEERKAAGNAAFSGEVKFYDFKKGYGYIQPENVGKMPANVKTALDASVEEEKARLNKKGMDKKAAKVEPLVYFRRGDVASQGKVFRGNKATFKLYLDNRGVGATEVNIQN